MAIAEVRRLSKRMTVLEPGEDPERLSAGLRQDGIQPMGQIPKDVCQGILSALQNKPLYNGYAISNSDRVARPLQDARQFPIGIHTAADVIMAQGALELANNPTILKAVESYLGCIPTIYSIGMWRSFSALERNATQKFHRDYDDFKFGSSGSRVGDLVDFRAPAACM